MLGTDSSRAHTHTIVLSFLKFNDANFHGAMCEKLQHVYLNRCTVLCLYVCACVHVYVGNVQFVWVYLRYIEINIAPTAH